VQDLHLAKRFYDKGIVTSAEAYLPCTLALILLSFKLFVNGELDSYITLDFAKIYETYENYLLVALCLLLLLLIFYRLTR